MRRHGLEFIHGTGRDQKNNSRARADVRFNLTDQNPGTRVDVLVDFTLAGTLAQFSRGAIVQSVAQRLTEEFARNLAAAMEARAPAAPTPEQDAAPTVVPQAAEGLTPVAAGPATREIKLFGLLWSIFTSWLHRQLGKLSWRRAGADR